MLDWLIESISSATASIVFLSIFIVGVTISSLSIFFGGHGDHDTDADADGDADHDADHDGDNDGEHDGGGLQGLSVAVFSIRGMALLSTGFGGVGLVVYLYTGKILFATVCGALFGYGFAMLILYGLRIFKAQQSNSIISTEEAVGGTGIVTTSIPQGGYGQVRIVIDGVEMYKMSTSTTGDPIKEGSLVHVDRVTGGTLSVSPG